MRCSYKKIVGLGLTAGTMALGLMACSDNGSNNPEQASNFGLDKGQLVSVALDNAESRMALCTRSVESAWYMASDQDTLSQAIDETFDANSFAVEAEAFLENENGYMTLASAGVDGNQDAWALRVENGKAMFAWRDASTGNEWYKVEADDALLTNDTITVRAERIDSLTVLSVNGVVKAAATSGTTIESLDGHFTIGFDPTSETENMPGRVLMVRFGKVRNVENKDDAIVSTESIDTEAPITLDPVETEGDSAVAEESAAEETWIAAWEFNDPTNVGKDYTGNGHDALAGEGSVVVTDSVATFDGASGLKVKLADDLKASNFVIEARVKPTAFSTMQNIVVAEPPGRGVDGWILRVNEGTLTFHMRDDVKNGDDWQIFDGKDLKLNEWNEIRVERSSDSIKILQDGELTVAAAYDGDMSQMSYDWGIGYDAMNQNFHTRYFKGDIDYIRFGTLTKLSEGTVKQSPFVLLADWEFNEPTFPGLDKIGNNSPKSVVGNATIEDGSLVLDGESGIMVPLTSTFKRSEFAVVARVKPTAFSSMQNIFVAEPPGRYGDGFIIRLDNGVLSVHLRDEAYGTAWNVVSSNKALELNQWTEIRVVLQDGALQVYQNDELVTGASFSGDVSQLGYDIGIGYDAVYQANHDRFFVGDIDYIRYYGVRE